MGKGADQDSELNRKAVAGTAERLDRPPPSDAYLRFPPEFETRFAIFVDTEEEFDWSRPPRREERSTRAAESLPILQRHLHACGVQPVYLVDHPIATDLYCVATLRELQERGECAIGTQLHPWVNPPFEEALTPRNSFAGNLPKELERAKLQRLTEVIDAAFGGPPRVYRAGRYGVGPHTAELLAEQGYRLDVSVRARFDYSAEGGPDFSAVQPFPYRVAGGLLELPLSAAYTGRLRQLGGRLFGHSSRVPLLRSVLARAGLLARIALTPEGIPLADAKAAVDVLLEDGVQLLSFSFHSPSAQPGHTPYVRDEADLRLFYGWWDGMFDHLARRGATPASLQDILGWAESACSRGR